MWMKNSVDPGQLAPSEAILNESTQFSIRDLEF